MRAVEPLLNLWNKNALAKSELGFALGRIGDQRAVEPIMAALEQYFSLAQEAGDWDTNSWTMRSLASALGQIGDSRANPLLEKMLSAKPQRTKGGEPKFLVAEAAANALRSMGQPVTKQEN